MTACAVDETSIVVSKVYPAAGASQFLCIVHCGKSERPPDEQLFLNWQDLEHTVLAGAFCPGKQVVLPTPLPPPYNLITLPPLSKHQLRPEIVRDEEGRVLGMMLRVPGLFVHANNILKNHLLNNTSYDYRTAVIEMLRESGRLLSSIIKSGIIRVRSHPGIMGHALELREMAADEIGISVAFAEKVLKKVQDKLPLQFGDVWDLDGFPVYAVRFPVANRYGVQEMYLRILPGKGRFIACNPYTLAKLWLGDRDGDALFGLLRWQDVRDEHLSIAKRPRVEVQHRISSLKSCMTLQALRDPSTIEADEKLQQKMVSPDLSTPELRLQYIKDADTRTHVATYTIVFGWHLPRVLAASGAYGPQEAYQRGNDVLEWFIEACMDARKGGSPLSDPKFDAHKFMRLLRFGKQKNETLDFHQLREIGVPDHLVSIIEEGWEISEGNFPAYCSKSPFYRALVIGRNNQDQGVPQMLLATKQMGIDPDKMYLSIIRDLTCSECMTVEPEE
jgi:hypothetical protein